MRLCMRLAQRFQGVEESKLNGLANEEFVSTQREMGRYDIGYEGYD
jgi:hypothetical protein